MTYIFISILSTLSLYFLPQRYWDRMHQQCIAIKHSLKPYISIILGVIPGWKQEKDRLALLRALKYRENELRRGVLVTELAFPDYLFFSDLLERLFYWSKNYGGQLTDLIKEIRASIIKEGKAQRNISKEIKETLVQISIVSITIWGFVYFSKSFLPTNNSQILVFAGMGFMHFLGFILLIIGHKIIRKKTFHGYDTLYKSLYGVYSLQKIGLSFQACLREIPLEELWALPGKFNQIKLELEELLADWKAGNSPTAGLKLLLDEVDFYFEQDLGAAQKAQTVQKFLILSFFYLPTYFLYLGSLFQGFLV